MPRGPIEKSRSNITAPTFTGQAKFANGAATAPSITFASETSLGFFRAGAGIIGVGSEGDERLRFGATDLTLPSSRALAWSSSSVSSAAADLILTRDAANTLALRNGTNAQEFRIGPTGDGLSLSKGTVEALITTQGLDHLGLGINGVVRWRVDGSTGNFLSATDNTYDIGDGSFNPRTIRASTSILAKGTGGIGYTTGAGGTVTQATSKATGVTLNTVTGEITMDAAALAADTSVSFTLTNSAIAAADLVAVTHHSAGTAGAYTVTGQAAAGSATITVRNVTAGSLSEAIVLKFAVIKGATS